jgi:hypothetical protein
MTHQKNFIASVETEAQILTSPDCLFTGKWMPSLNAVAIVNKAIELFNVEENYVKACKYLIESGFRIDLDYRPSYIEEWTRELQYKIEFHKPTVYKGITQYVPFPLRDEPIEEYKDSAVIRVSFKHELEFGNAMRGLHAFRNFGLVVMKKKRTPEDIEKQKQRKEEQKRREVLAYIEHQAKKKHHNSKITLSEEVKISTFNKTHK